MGSRTQHRGLTLQDLNDDVLLVICDHLTQEEPFYDLRYGKEPGPKPLKNLSCVNRRLRALLRPRLMQSIALTKTIRMMHQQRAPPISNGWEIARKGITEMMEKDDLLQNLRELRLDLYGKSWDNDFALRKQFLLHISFFRRLSRLQVLSLTLPHDYMLLFENTLKSEFEADPFTWQHLTAICLDFRMTCLLEYCPNLRRLALYDSGGLDTRIYQLSLLSSQLPRYITHLEARARWTRAEVTYLADTFPYIHHLAVHEFSGYSISTECFLKEIGKGFKELKVLALPGVSRLRVGLEAEYGNIFSEESRKETLARYEKGKLEAMDRAAGMAFAACEKLEECWLGEGNVARILSRTQERSGKTTNVQAVAHTFPGPSLDDEEFSDDDEDDSDKGSDKADNRSLAELAKGITWTWAWSQFGEKEFSRRKGRMMYIGHS